MVLVLVVMVMVMVIIVVTTIFSSSVPPDWFSCEQGREIR